MIDLEQATTFVQEKLSQRNYLIQTYKRKKEELAGLQQVVGDLNEARDIVIEVSRAIQQEVHNQIAAIVSECLEIVFDEPYTFEIQFERKYDRTFANLVFIRDGETINPMDASGGGVIDVASFALRLSCMMLSKPKLRRLLVLDEPFKFVSLNYQERVREMLETLSERLNIQIIMVTHINKLVTGKEVEL